MVQRMLRAAMICVVVWLVAFSSLIARQAVAQLQLDDATEPLAPKQARTEAEQDRLEAEALFATARTLEQNEDPAGALRRYQRAFRYHPSATILAEIIPLAFSLGRDEEAVRYAILAIENDPTDATLLRRMALHLTEQSDYKRALHMYELWLENAPDDAKAADRVLVRMEMGRLYFLTENYAKAADAFAHVSEALAAPQKFGLDQEFRGVLLGEGALTYQLFGECFLNAGRLDDAQAAYEKSHEQKANRGMLGYNLARVLAMRNRPIEALDKLESYFQDKLATEGMAPYELLAQLLADLNQQDAVDDRLETLRSADPGNVPLAMFLAGRYLEEGELERAETIYKESLATSKRPALEMYRGLIEVYQRTKKPEALLATLGEGVGRTGGLELFEDQVALILADGKQVDALVELAKSKREKDGFQPVPGEALAIAELALKAEKFDEADRFFAWAVEDQPDQAAGLTLGWGLELFMAERYDAAAALFQKAIDEGTLPKDNPAPYFYLAGAQEMSGETDKALAAAEKAVALEPDAAQFVARVCWIHYHAKRYDDAIAAYKKLIARFDSKHEPSETRDALREARLVLSNIHVLRQDYLQAEEYLEQVLDEFPEDAGALNDLGYLWADQNKRLERSLTMIETALAAEPDNAAYLDSHGWVLYRLGRFDEAVAPLERAAEGEEVDGVILDHLADVYFAQGDKEKAKATWTQAIKAFERDEDEKKADEVRKKVKSSEQ